MGKKVGDLRTDFGWLNPRLRGDPNKGNSFKTGRYNSGGKKNTCGCKKTQLLGAQNGPFLVH